MPDMITSWSFSRYSDYVKCPRLAFFKHVKKMKEPGSAAMDRGTAIHKLAERYIKGELRTLPQELSLFGSEFKKLKAGYKKVRQSMTVEDNWAFTKDWEETEWNNWTQCWVRVKLDLAWFADDTTLYVDDFKTGKFRSEQNASYMEQLELYALCALLTYPTIKDLKVYPRLMYLDAGVWYPPADDPVVWTHADVDKLKKLWAIRTKKMLSDKVFKPTPGYVCNYCHFRESNGGPCILGSEYD